MTNLAFGTLASKIVTEADAYKYLEGLRWPEKPVCPHCGMMNDHYFLKPSNGVSRKTTRGSDSQRRVWKCKDCRKQFSVLTNTIFHGSKIPLQTWLFVFFEMCCSENGIAAREIARRYGVAPKTAWFMTQRIREATANDNFTKMSGNNVADETYIVGDPRNWHASDPRKSLRGRGTQKTAVVALIEAESGQIRTRGVTNVSGTNLRKVIKNNVDVASSVLHTDSFTSYTAVSKEMVARYVVDHHVGQQVTEL
jgi:transposase-like protein